MSVLAASWRELKTTAVLATVAMAMATAIATGMVLATVKSNQVEC